MTNQIVSEIGNAIEIVGTFSARQAARFLINLSRAATEDSAMGQEAKTIRDRF